MLKDILNETYGFPVYQEQVMQIMTKAGGYDLGHADDVRRFMSKKKKDKLEAEEPTFVKGCIANGIKESDAKWLFEQLKPFAEYGFNKSHAAAYSLVSYLTAWCKHYYPEEYLCAAMSARGEKTLQFLNDCKLYGIEVLPVDINTSDADFSVEEKGKIRIGLSAVKGLSSDANVIVEARKDGFYKSIEDIIKRVKIKANVFKALILAGACDSFNDNREAALEFATRYSEVYSEYVTAKEKVDLYTAENKKDTLAKWTPRYEEAEKQLDSVKMRISNPLSTEARLAYESLYLGMWVTGSPLEDYDTENPKYISIEELNIGDYVKTIGVITDYRKFKTKKGDTMAAFTILDKDSVEIKCVLYPKNYESLDIELADNMVIELDGEMSEWDDESQIDVFKVKSMKAGKKSLLLRCGLIKYVEDIEPIVERHMIQNGGMELRIILNGQLRECKAHVSDDIISEIEKLDVEYSVA
jgi:DNA polymerase-3 subunit alpha